VVVDGMEDGTFKRAKKLQSSRIKIFGYKKNRGKGYAIRYGMARTKGDYVAFIDSGMEIDPNGLSMILEHMEWYDADIIVGSKRHPASQVNYPLSRKIVSWLYQLFVRVFTGLNVRDTQAGLKIFKRKVLIDILPRLMIQYANNLGMWTICTNIIGFPYEKINSIKDTINFAKTSGTDFAVFYLLTPQPTSEVYEYFKKENLLNFDRFFEDLKMDRGEFERISYTLSNAGADTKFFRKEELLNLQKRAYREFILYRGFEYLTHPSKIRNKINSKEDLFYVFKLLIHGIKVFSRALNPSFLKGTGNFLYKVKTLKHKK
jgi:glycosyltransferase involved in cell wall biosynthesis